MTTKLDSLELRSPFYALLLRASFGILPVAICVWLIWAFMSPETVPTFQPLDEPVSWAVFIVAICSMTGVALVVLDALLNLFALPSRSRCLKIGTDGFEEVWPFRSRYVAWAGCGRFQVTGRWPARHVGFKRTNPAFDLWMGAARRRVGLQAPMRDFVRGNYGIKPENLANLMNRYREAALERVG